MATPVQRLLWVSASHWDREWHRPFEGFRYQLVEMVDRAIDGILNVPGYSFFFLDGQSILLEDYLAIRPEREGVLRELIASGRIGAGPFYVLQDEMVEDGELLVRNLQRGVELAQRFGATEMVGYSPDAFGHCAQLPQLLRLAGVGSAVFGRGFAGTQQENLWSAPDGSAVFLLWLPLGYGGFAHQDCLDGARHLPEDGAEALAMFETRVARLLPYVRSGVALVMDGGDHLMADAHAVDLQEAFNAKHAGQPRFEISSLPAAVRAVSRGGVPARVDGEVRMPGASGSGWILTGTYTTRMPLKHGLSTLTRQLLALERLACTVPHSPVVATQLERAWQFLLQNTPHDSICGCHIDEVYLENLTRLHSARCLINALYEQCLRAYAPAGARTARQAQAILYDPTPEPTLFKPFAVECTYPCIADPDQVTLEAAGADLVLSTVEPFQTQHSHLATYRITGFLRNRGRDHVLAASLRPARPRPALPDLEAVPTPLTFLDSGDAGDTYTYSPPLQDTLLCTSGRVRSARVRRLSANLIQTRMEVSLELPAALTPERQGRSAALVEVPIRYEIVTDSDSGVTWVQGVVHNTARDHRLRLVIPTPGRGEVSLAGAAFHVERRPVALAYNPDEYTERPLTDYPFVDYISYGGISVYAQSNGEYQVTERGIEITLCRCVGYVGRPDLAYRQGQAGPFFETPTAQLCDTDIPFAFAMAPALADPAADYRRRLVLLGQVVTQCVLSDDSAPVRGCLPVRVGGAELSALRRRSESEFEARIFNGSANPAVARLEWVQGVGDIREVDLTQRPLPQGLALSAVPEAMVPLRPWQIITLRLSRAETASPR